MGVDGRAGVIGANGTGASVDRAGVCRQACVRQAWTLARRPRVSALGRRAWRLESRPCAWSQNHVPRVKTMFLESKPCASSQW